MIEVQELEAIDVKEAREALSILISEGKSLWKTYEDDPREIPHWLNLSFTALEPLPEHQQRFRQLCGNKLKPAGARLSAGIHVLESSIKKMDEDGVNIETPSLSYRRLISSLPD